MHTKTIQIPFDNFGGEGPVIHFAHANGFPPKTYRQFLEPLSESYKVIAIKHRPLWQENPDSTSDWQQVTNDLIQFLDSQNLKNIVGVGHSMGAVATMFASAKRPDLFSHLILIEPVFILPKHQFTFSLIPSFLKKTMNPMIKGALKRQDNWANRQTVFDSWRSKRVFSKMSDESLWDYVNAGTLLDEKGQASLAYSKYWEANYYGKIPKIWGALKKIKVPTLGIRGADSNTIFPEAWKKWKGIQKEGTFLEMEGYGHLVPVESPLELSEMVLNFLKEN